MTTPYAPENAAFLLEEDNALKQHLTGLTVSDDRRSTRPVPVWFGQPDLELRARTYPYISIELVDLGEDTERTVVGLPELTYVPPGYSAPANGEVMTAHNFPLPYNLDYQITVWSRHPRHDRQIMRDLLAGPLRLRFGSVFMPETNRVARLDILGGPRVADTTDENGKRLFRKVFTGRMSTELFPDQALAIAGLIQSVHINAPTTPDPSYEVIEAVIT